LLAKLLNIPRNYDEWLEWSYHHRSSHDAIRRAIQAKFGTNLADYPIDPINPDDFETFLNWNFQLHIDMNGPTKNNGVDLEDVDLTNEREKIAWIFLHYQEHFAAESDLGI
jgi:hypothetical protein